MYYECKYFLLALKTFHHMEVHHIQYHYKNTLAVLWYIMASNGNTVGNGNNSKVWGQEDFIIFLKLDILFSNDALK